MRCLASCFVFLALSTLPSLAFAQTEAPAPLSEPAANEASAAPSESSAPVSNAAGSEAASSAAGSNGTATASSGAVTVGGPSEYDAPEGTPETEQATEDRFLYLSFSPLHLVSPIVEVTAEFKVHRRIGVAVIGGYGSIRPQPTVFLTTPPRVQVWEVGGQFITYPVGHFDHGMQLGAEVQYVGASTKVTQGEASATGVGVGVSSGAFVGYKLATSVGFSFNVQGGVAYFIGTSEARGSDGSRKTGQDSGVIPLLNINLGWSF